MDRYGYVFPYDKIKKGSRIIIWGAGEVGRQYWYQIKKTGYCEVTAVIDNRARSENACTVVKPINCLLDRTVEYVLLALADDEKRKEAKEYLAEFCPHVICVEAGHYGANCLADVSGMELCEVAGWKYLFSQFWKYSLGNYSYIQDLIDEVRTYQNNQKITMAVAEGISGWNQYEQIVALRMLMNAECFNSQLMELYHRALSNIKEHELCAVLLEEITSYEVSHSEICYPEYYNDRRRIIKNNTYALLNNTPATKEYHIAGGQEINKICILRQNLPSAKLSNATKWVVEWANSFSRLGCQVMVVSASLFEKQRVVSFINVSWDEPFDENSDFFESNVLIYKASGGSIGERMQDTVSIIKNFGPDLVIDTCSHHDMLTCVLYKMFPLLHIPFRGSNSSTFFHRSLLQSKRQYEEEWMTFHSIPRNLARFAAYVNVKFDDGADWPNEAREEFHVASAGNRIIRELPEEFVKLMCAWLKSKDNAKWYIIGPMQKSDFNCKYYDMVDCGKIIFPGYQTDLAAYYLEEKIDIMIFPKITGVGMCAALAVNNHIPVIKSRSNGDIEKYLGEASAVKGELINLINRLDELYYDVSKRKQLVDKELTYLHTFDDSDKYVLRILEVGREILSDIQQEVNFEFE